MVVHTRLDCVLGTAAGMRQAVEQATHHAAHRLAFGKLLAEQPLMRNVLADLCPESEPETLEVLLEEIRLAEEPRVSAFAEQALREADEARSRRLVERLAPALQASLLVRHAPAEVADAFLAARLGGEGGLAYGTLPPS